MSNIHESRTYFELEITGNSRSVDIWLGDDGGSLVQKERGVLRTSLLPGDYVVEFGLGTGCYPIRLVQDSHYTQSELQAGPICTRPMFQLSESEADDQGR